MKTATLMVSILGLAAAMLQGCAASVPTLAQDSAPPKPARDSASAGLPTDQAALAKIASGNDNRNRGARAAAIQRIADRQLLLSLANPVNADADDLIEVAARLRLVMLDPVVTARIPGAAVAIEYSSLSQTYNVGPIGGEVVTLTVQRDSQPLAQGRYRTDFPVAQTVYGGVPRLFPARVDIAALLTELFGRPEFTADDLKKLSRSPIVEAQIAAVNHVDDQAVILRVLDSHSPSRLRVAAVDRLTDQAQLARFALNDQDFGVRMNATAKLTDQAQLLKVVRGDKVDQVRAVAVKKLDDPDLLKQLAYHDRDQGVRLAALAKLGITGEAATNAVLADIREVSATSDQSILAKHATDDPQDYVRQAAVGKLTDRSLLERIAARDESAMVREAAKDRLKQLRGGAR